MEPRWKLLVMLVLRSFYWAPVIVLEDGTPVCDLTVSEVGDFAQEEFTPHRKLYLANLKEYRTLPFRPLDGNVASAGADLAAELRTRLSRDLSKKRPQAVCVEGRLRLACAPLPWMAGRISLLWLKPQASLLR